MKALPDEICCICKTHGDGYLIENENGDLECWPSCEEAADKLAELNAKAKEREYRELAADHFIEARRDALLEKGSV